MVFVILTMEIKAGRLADNDTFIYFKYKYIILMFLQILFTILLNYT